MEREMAARTLGGRSLMKEFMSEGRASERADLSTLAAAPIRRRKDEGRMKEGGPRRICRNLLQDLVWYKRSLQRLAQLCSGEKNLPPVVLK